MIPRMKKIFYLLLTVMLCACGQQGRMASGDALVLDGGWQLSREGAAEQYAATVPSTVCGVLSEAGYFGDDLFDGRNYAAVDKAPFDDVWTYSTTFTAKPAAGQFVELAFDGLNYYADIFLNGTQLASSDTTFGVFRRRAYEVGSLLKGNNRPRRDRKSTRLESPSVRREHGYRSSGDAPRDRRRVRRGCVRGA